MNAAKDKAKALRYATAFAVKDWPKKRGEIPRQRGVYMFTGPEGCPIYVGSASGTDGIRGRLRHQVCPSRIGTPWTLYDPHAKKVLKGRNLLGNVFTELNDGRLTEINPANKQQVDYLNQALERIHEMTVQWVKCPDRKTAIRAEHCAICLYQPKYVEK